MMCFLNHNGIYLFKGNQQLVPPGVHWQRSLIRVWPCSGTHFYVTEATGQNRLGKWPWEESMRPSAATELLQTVFSLPFGGDFKSSWILHARNFTSGFGARHDALNFITLIIAGLSSGVIFQNTVTSQYEPSCQHTSIAHAIAVLACSDHFEGWFLTPGEYPFQMLLRLYRFQYKRCASVWAVSTPGRVYAHVWCRRVSHKCDSPDEDIDLIIAADFFVSRLRQSWCTIWMVPERIGNNFTVDIFQASNVRPPKDPMSRVRLACWWW